MTSIPLIEHYPMPAQGDLPENTAGWSFEPQRSVLLVHDMQRFFVRPLGGPIRNELISNIALLRNRCKALDVPIAYTTQPGGMTDDQRGLLKDFWGPGMRSEPADREVVDELAPDQSDWIFTKWRYSAFFRSDLLEKMRAHGRDQLVISGVYAHVGVLMTAVDAFTNDIETFLVADAIADFSAHHHHQTIKYAAQRCAVVCTTKELLR